MLRLATAAIIAMSLSYGTANAQVVFKGPTEGKVNKQTRIVLDKVDGDDLQIQGFVDGKPVTDTEGDWMVMKNLKDQVVIFIMTDKGGTYTFVAGVNKGGKTLLSNHSVVMGEPKPAPTPDPVVPTPPKPVDPVVPDTSLGGKLKTAYRVSPDAASLSKLIAILEEVSGQNYKTFDDMEAVLSTTGKKFLPNGELQKLRDLITDEIVSKLGTDPRKRDIDKVKDIYKQAITALKGV